MSSLFNNTYPKPTFGTLQQDLSSSDYLQLKKKRVLNKANFSSLSLNRSNLIYNLYSKENLKDVTVLTSSDSDSKNPYINPSLSPFYKYYKIDPVGELFGNSQCGINNFTKYMEPNCI